MWDVAEHVVIALRVLKEMDLEPTMFDAFLRPEHSYTMRCLSHASEQSLGSLHGDGGLCPV